MICLPEGIFMDNGIAKRMRETADAPPPPLLLLLLLLLLLAAAAIADCMIASRGMQSTEGGGTSMQRENGH